MLKSVQLHDSQSDLRILLLLVLKLILPNSIIFVLEQVYQAINYTVKPLLRDTSLGPKDAQFHAVSTSTM